MGKYFDKATIFAWMPMIGFDREKEDKGVGAFLERTQFTPDGTSVFLFHPDFVLQHDGLDKEFGCIPTTAATTPAPITRSAAVRIGPTMTLKLW